MIERRGDPAARMAGKVVLIVGGGQIPGETIGNGRATAQLFGHHGARVVVADLHRERARETVEEIRAEGGEAVAHAGDVRAEDDCRAMVDAAHESFGGLDVVHYNVGFGAGDVGVHRTPVELWQRIHDVNLTGAFLVSRAAAPALKERGGGAMLFTSSVAAVAGVGMSAYKTSKAGLNALAHSLAVTHARDGIRVNTIMPGLIDTPMAIQGVSETMGLSAEETRERRNRRVPLGRQMGTAWDVAYAALFLCSDESRWVTGVELLVDGGQMTRKA